MIGLPSLAKLASPARPAAAEARCELCSSPLAERHRHVVELGRRGVLCACHACALLFANGDGGARYKTVPERVRVDAAFAVSPQDWAQLGIPVGLAFFHRDSARACTVAGYPGPAGVVEAELEPSVWQAIADATPLARELADDVEALLVRGTRGAARMTCYLVPISATFALVARLRASWQGFSGGDAAERELAAYFAALEQQGGAR